MLYKGGPKNYSKRDWQLAAWIFGGLFVLALIGAALSPKTTASSAGTPAPQASAEYREAAERAGYKGKKLTTLGLRQKSFAVAQGSADA